MIELVSTILLCVGGFFYFAGTLGLLRFPDVYSRLHALAKADNLGLGCILLGLAIQEESLACHCPPCRCPWHQALAPGGQMSLGLSFDLLLGASLLWSGWRALSTPRLDRALVLFIVFGLLMTLTWARLAAPDIALAEAAIGAGLTGALLLDAYGVLQAKRLAAEARK